MSYPEAFLPNSLMKHVLPESSVRSVVQFCCLLAPRQSRQLRTQKGGSISYYVLCQIAVFRSVRRDPFLKYSFRQTEGMIIYFGSRQKFLKVWQTMFEQHINPTAPQVSEALKCEQHETARNKSSVNSLAILNLFGITEKILCISCEYENRDLILYKYLINYNTNAPQTINCMELLRLNFKMNL